MRQIKDALFRAWKTTVVGLLVIAAGVYVLNIDGIESEIKYTSAVILLVAGTGLLGYKQPPTFPPRRR